MSVIKLLLTEDESKETNFTFNDIWQKDLDNKLSSKEKYAWMKYLEPKIRKYVDKIDRACLRPVIDLIFKRFDRFVKLHPNYWFHIPTGFLLHIFDKQVFSQIRPMFGYIKLGIHRPCPARRLLLGLRRVPGPRGGKYAAIGSVTHISCKDTIVRNPKTRFFLKKARLIAVRKKWRYPNYFAIEKRFYQLPFFKYRPLLKRISFPG